MKRFLAISLFLFSFGFVGAQTLSENARISLLSCGYGKELYAQFGHTGIRIQDPDLHIDWVFNYGTFNYETEGFYLKFVKGITDYQLGFDLAVDFFIRYKYRDISVWEQHLALSAEEKQRMFDALMHNFKPENRFYRYNFVYDNCATRPRDMIELAVQDSVLYMNKNEQQTFRQLIAECVGTDTWNKFGIDIVLGASADKLATDREKMFLPLELMFYLKAAKRYNGTLLVSKTDAVYISSEQDISAASLPKPIVLAFTLLFLVVVIGYLGRNKTMIWLDMLLFGLCGLMGVVVFYLNFFSLHPLVSENYNLLWLNPLQLIFALLLPFKKIRTVLGNFHYINLLSLLFALAGFVFLPQAFNIAFLPLMLLLFSRSLFIIYYQRRN